MVEGTRLNAGTTYYIRCKYIRGFNRYFPEVDSAIIVKFTLEYPQYFLLNGILPRDIHVDMVRWGGKDFINPKSSKGLWYIPFKNIKYIYADTVLLAKEDKPDFKLYAKIKYVDEEKYGKNNVRYIAINNDKELAILKNRSNMYNDLFLISSKSDPNNYSLVKFLGCIERELESSLPEAPLDRHLLSNSEIAMLLYKGKQSKTDKTVVENGISYNDKCDKLEKELAELKELAVSQALTILNLKKKLR